MKKRFHIEILFKARKTLLVGLLVGGLVLGVGSTQVTAGIKTDFLYTLSNFSGPVPYNWASMSVDEERNEIYVVDRSERDVSIFDKNGMEVYRFGDNGSLGTPLSVAVKEDGSILVLSKRRLKNAVTLCNFRGEPQSELKIKNLPPEFSYFSPDHLAYRDERIYLLDSISMRIAVTDTNGVLKNSYDLAAFLKIEEKKRGTTVIGGFSVDRQGNLLFTVPVLFSAYTLSPEGKIKNFGRSGSTPGGFGIVGGIIADEKGNYYVADRLRSVVLIFGKDLEFKSEFGYRGVRPHNLIGPKYLVLDNQNRLYVSQLRSRGISVFKLIYDR